MPNAGKMQQKILNAPPMNAKIRRYSVASSTRQREQENGATHQKPLKRGGPVGPIPPTTSPTSLKSVTNKANYSSNQPTG
jgi:hypothetical protein